MISGSTKEVGTERSPASFREEAADEGAAAAVLEEARGSSSRGVVARSESIPVEKRRSSGLSSFLFFMVAVGAVRNPPSSREPPSMRDPALEVP